MLLILHHALLEHPCMEPLANVVIHSRNQLPIHALQEALSLGQPVR